MQLVLLAGKDALDVGLRPDTDGSSEAGHNICRGACRRSKTRIRHLKLVRITKRTSLSSYSSRSIVTVWEYMVEGTNPLATFLKPVPVGR